jgi:hypothetical protein
MVYVVHETNGNKFTAFHEHKDAFALFKRATKDQWSDAALWCGNDYEGWTLVHSTRSYPETYTKPWGCEWLVR